MRAELRILILEDSIPDATLLLRKLRDSGCTFDSRRVDTREEFARQVVEFQPDLVLSDYSMPGFDGVSALKILREHSDETPFIFVSGCIGEERAIDALRLGATDYVLKDHIGRLIPAIERAMSDVADRAERRALEERLRQSQKMEAIGRLAGGVAHDFNNLLTAIIGYGEMALERAGLDAGLRGDLGQILEASERARSLTRQLLAFSRRQVLTTAILDVNAIVRKTLELLKRVLGENVQISIDLAPDLLPVEFDATQIDQVIMNLAVNARDAMPDGGRLDIATRNSIIDDAHRRNHPEAMPGPAVQIIVSDSGLGMDAETQRRIFEPFFTTKEAGKGTGLGLSTVYGIVQQARGSIEIESALGAGTTFRIRMPATSKAAEATSAASIESSSPAAPSATILLVEDEDLVLSLLIRMLSSAGYAVLEASDADRGEAAAASHEGAIHLLITDMVLPGRRGSELAAAVAKLRPGIPVLFISGYTEESVAAGIPGVSRLDFIEKPLTQSKLLATVRRLLQGDSDRVP